MREHLDLTYLTCLVPGEVLEQAGGRDAADELHARVKDHLKKLELDAENTDIAVQVYADLKNLGSASVKSRKMEESSSMILFAHGFNQRQALFDFVDVIPGGEAADNKVRGACIACEPLHYKP